MNRRTFLATTLGSAAAIPLLSAGKLIDRSRVSAITDEVAHSQEDSIAFAKKFGLEWLSLRDIPSTERVKTAYYSLEGDSLKQAVDAFKNEGIRISFLDTPFLKFGLPGTEPLRKTPEQPEAREKRVAREKVQFDSRLDDLRKGIRAAHAFHCNQVRFFSFTRIAEPESLYPRIAEIVAEMADIAQKEGISLLIENEYSQNVGTSLETAKFMKLMPQKNVGINWDSLNGLVLGEKPYPDGYETLPKARIHNVHVKGKSLLDYPEHQDWPGIIRSLERDGFTGRLELETHISGDQQIPGSNASMKEILRLLGAQG